MGRLSWKRSNTDNKSAVTSETSTSRLSTSERDSAYAKKIKIDPDMMIPAESKSFETHLKKEQDVDGLADDDKNSDQHALQSPRGTYDVETDPAVLARRAKQIDYGKTTKEYSNYTKAIPREDRASFHPKTPNSKRKYSRRAWDGLIKQWRLNLHLWSDNPNAELDFSQNGKIRMRNDSTSSAATTTSNTTNNTESEKELPASPGSPSPSIKEETNKSDIFSESWSKQMDDDEEDGNEGR